MTDSIAPKLRTGPVDVKTAIKVAQMMDCCVFPLNEHKRPKLSFSWQDISTNDPGEIRRLWGMSGPSFIGVDCEKSALTVVDLDDLSLVGDDLMRLLSVNPTLEFRSVGKGLPHHVYRGVVKSTTFPGGDLKSAGGYVLLSVDKDIIQREIMDFPPDIEALMGISHDPRSGRGEVETSEGEVVVIDLDDWLGSLTDSIGDGSDIFIETQIERFRANCAKNHRRMAARDACFSMALEAASGYYPAADAYNELRSAYIEVRNADPNPVKHWNTEREKDYRTMWAGVASQIAAGLYDDRIAQQRRDKGLDEDENAAVDDWLDELGVSGSGSGTGTLVSESDSETEHVQPPKATGSTAQSAAGVATDPISENAAGIASEVQDQGAAPSTTPETLAVPGFPAVTPTVVVVPKTPAAEIPKPPASMFYGPHGEFALAVEENTEAYAPAVMLTAMSAWGALLGNGFTLEIGDAEHGPNLFVILVGESAESRKGTSLSPVRKAYEDPKLGAMPLPMARGFNSHKGLLNYFMPTLDKDADGEAVPVWGDPRLWWLEDEFTKVLNAANAKGPAGQMGPTIRELWDGNSIENRISGETIVIPAERHHVSMTGAITKIELIARMPDTDFFGGTGNRMLWLPVPVLPESRWRLDGDNTPRSVVSRYVDFLADGRRRLPVGSHRYMEVVDQPGGAMWREFNREIRHRVLGMTEGSKQRLLHGRAPVYVARMALNLALADGEAWFKDRHVRVAIDIWNWLASGMEWVFGGSTGDPQYDYYLGNLPGPSQTGMSAVEQRKMFGPGYIALRARGISENRVEEVVMASGPSGGGKSRLVRRTK